MTASLILAWLVHLYTASGAVVAFGAIVLINQQSFQQAFWLMSLAVVIDSTDGTLARAAGVKEQIPWFDGDRLEDLIDYANYVIVPCWFLLHADILPPQDAFWLAALPLLASAYGFCRKDAKTSDHFFLGFPSYWNVVVFYMYVIQAPVWINAFALLILSALVFVPLKYIYPSRTVQYRPVTIALGSVWAVSVLFIIYTLPEPPRLVVLGSLVFPIYYLALSFWLDAGRFIAKS